MLALRRIPIYAPGGGDAVLGEIGKPTYSVAITDAEAAANREAFAAQKEAKRLFPSKKPEPKKSEEQDQKGGKFSGTDYFDNASNRGNVTTRSGTRPSTGGTSEKTAVETLSTRPPAEDSARDDWDCYRGDMTTTPGGHPIAESRRGNEVEEVRGMLHRVSTRGRRKTGGVGGNGGQVQTPAIPSVIAEVQTRPLRPTSHQQPFSEQQNQWGEGEMRSQESGTLPSTSLSTTYLQYQPSPVPLAVVNNRTPPVGNAFAQQTPQSPSPSSQQQRSQAQPRILLPPIQAYASLPQQLPPPEKPLPRDP